MSKGVRPQVARSAEEVLAIQEVTVRYGFVIDDRDWDAVDQVLTEDAVIDYRDHRANPPRGLAPLVGRDEIIRHFRDVLTHPYQHIIVNQLIEDVSDDEVIVRCKALCPIPGQRLLDIEYRDVVVRTAAGWRIKHLSVKRYNDEPAPWLAEQIPLWRSRGAHIE